MFSDSSEVRWVLSHFLHAGLIGGRILCTAKPGALPQNYMCRTASGSRHNAGNEAGVHLPVLPSRLFVS